ncbi:neprilysin-1-like [Dermacentor silvarum]|uniref:neprilysin-1-like n=1 Tax=Dermacentor silvarum TaxID=543639 RepID=UPI00189B86B5|nr:neprilysin-1-like [Dermacentor silvarum]
MNLVILASLMAFPCLSYSTPTTIRDSEGNYSVCCEPVCIERANMIKEALNTSVNPCDDFYSYACGGWEEKHPIPDTKSSIGSFDLLHDELQETLRSIFQNMTLVEENQNITDKVAAVYNACVEVPTKEDQVEVLYSLMNISGFGQWPIKRGDSSPTIGNCTEVLNNIPIVALLPMYIDRDVKLLNSSVVQMDQLGFPWVGRNQLLHPNTTENKPIIAAYKTVVKTALKLMNSTLTEDEVSALADTLVDFEGQLANLTAPPEERRNFMELYHRTTIGKLQKNFTQIPLLQMLNKQFSLVNITLSENETIELYAMEYYSKLDEFLGCVDCETLFNFAGLREILNWAARASQEFRNVSFELTKASSGIKVEKPRWEKCVSAINGMMPEIVGYLYVLQKFSEEAKKEVEDLVRRLTTIFNETVQNNDWMDNKTKSAAEEKLAKMTSKIGYPSWLLNKTYLEQLYIYVPNLNLSSPYLEMSYYIEANNWKRQMLQLRKPYDKESVWFVGPAVVNAFYNPAANEMVYPSGILQGVFYQYGLPRSLNFGAVGMVVGHEMTHGFDDTGSQFDADGALKQWWTNETRAEFNKKAECFIYQYGNITDEEANMTINGRNTVGENIADNGGMRMAFKAYERLLQDECHGQDTRLPGLTDLSGKKLFFIAEAMVWCSRMRKERQQFLIQYDPHSPDKYRVNIPMQNMEEFSEVFQCKNDSAMNPRQRCKLW